MDESEKHIGNYRIDFPEKEEDEDESIDFDISKYVNKDSTIIILLLVIMAILYIILKQETQTCIAFYENYIKQNCTCILIR